MDLNSYRLPNSVVPYHYKIDYKEIDLDNFVFSGVIQISVNVLSNTNTVIINGYKLSVSDVKVIQNNRTIELKCINVNLEKETIEFYLEEDLLEGKCEICMSFKGEISKSLSGLYRSKYQVNGKDKFMCVSHFESCDARAAFPCFDEPSMKAVFEISVITTNDKCVISNMEIIERRRIDNDKVFLQFDKSPIMSSYLVALLIGEFDSVSKYTNNGIKVTVYTPLNQSKNGLFALECAIKSIEFYSDFFGIKYPLPKCDLVAISDFAAGAMENWGCLTFRETMLLFDSENSSMVVRKRVALCVGHELAHQWFGNLVTMKWWNDLWLNEGFAKYMEYICVDSYMKEWNIWEFFEEFIHNPAYKLDSLISSHPIEVSVNDPREISQLFDIISYRKGASILLMLNNYLGIDDFRKGLNLYLTRFSYKNACTEDLWSSLEEISHKPVSKIMNNYITKEGYPLISLSEKDGKIELKQERYLKSTKSVNNDKWNIPLTALLIKENGENEIFELPLINEDDNKNNEILEELMILRKRGIVKLNVNQSTFCRINYDIKWRKELFSVCNTDRISSVDKIGLISDLFALSICGKIPISECLDLLKIFKDEKNMGVWSEIFSHLCVLLNLYSEESFYPKLQKYVIDLYINKYNEIGWEKKDNEIETVNLFRCQILKIMIKCGYKDAIDTSKSLYYTKIKEGEYVSPDIRSTCYKSILNEDDYETAESNYNELIMKLSSINLTEEKKRIMGALGQSKHEKLIKRTLELTVDSNTRSQDINFIITSCTGNPKGKYISWLFFKNHYDYYCKTLDTGTMLTNCVSNFIVGLRSEDDLKDIKEFFKDKDTRRYIRKLNNAIETIENRIERMKRDIDCLNKYSF